MQQEVVTVGVDLAKNVFQVHAIGGDGKVLVRRQLRRGEVLKFFSSLPPCLVGMEACASAHHWGRELLALDHDVRLMPLAYVKPYVKRGKTDAADAEAICEAVTRPTMRAGAQGRAGQLRVIEPPASVRVYLAPGVTDMRKGLDGLAALVQPRLRQDPFGCAVYAFRGKCGDLVALLWWDGQGLVLHAKRLERGRFTWPATADGVAVLTPAQLSMPLEGVDWRHPIRSSQPSLAW